ncbi:MAG: hypothetical protein FWH01_04735 [Oscillospiraceae bacterium]|nr:hypothetical protein [Oscillospiraceae bacterium]
MKKCRKVIALFIGLLLCFSMFTMPVAAARVNFPLRALNGALVADANTEYITSFSQDPVTKMITATVQVKHGSIYSSEPLALHGLNVSMSYSAKVAPYFKSAKTLFAAGRTSNSYSEFAWYSKPLYEPFNIVGSAYIRRDYFGGGVVSGTFTCAHPDYTLKVAPGQKIDVVELYFMPINGYDSLDLGMFGYTNIVDRNYLLNSTPWIGNGTRFMHYSESGASAYQDYVVSPTSFKMEAAGAAANGFPLIALNGDLVADQNTKYITQLSQNPTTKLITATVQIYNGNAQRQLSIMGISAAMSYSGKVAPYDKATGSYFSSGGAVTSIAEFKRYSTALINGFDLFGSTLIRGGAGGGSIGGKLSIYEPDKILKINPGQTVDIMEMYFMPVNGNDTLDASMFSYSLIVEPGSLLNLSPWLAHGTRYLYHTAYKTSTIETYVVSPESFSFVIKTQVVD